MCSRGDSGLSRQELPRYSLWGTPTFRDKVVGKLAAFYILRLASHASRIGRLLGSIKTKAIPIPELGRE